MTSTTRSYHPFVENLWSTIGARARATRWPAIWLALLCIAYVFPGLVGHDPWKQDETYVTSIIHHMAETQDWVIPTNAGQPFMEKPPLYFVVAQQTAELLAPWFPMHDGARLSNVLWIALVLACLGQSARCAWGERRRRAPIAAILKLLSSVGLVMQAHLLMVDVALLAGFAVALLGFCNILKRPDRGAVLLGIGTGIGFLAKGLIAPGCLGVTALLLPLLFQPWRTRSYFKALALAAVVSLPWVVIWPAALYFRDQQLFDQWLWRQNFGRFFGYAHFGADPEPWYYAKTLPWFAFPALPAALWALWRRRAAWRDDPPLQLCVTLATIIIVALSVAGSMRAIYLLPVLLPFSLLAAAELEHLPDAIQDYSFRAAYLFYGAAAVALWGVCLIIDVAGEPPAWLELHRLLPLSIIPRAEPSAVALAVLATAGWLAAITCGGSRSAG